LSLALLCLIFCHWGQDARPDPRPAREQERQEDFGGKRQDLTPRPYIARPYIEARLDPETPTTITSSPPHSQDKQTSSPRATSATSCLWAATRVSPSSPRARPSSSWRQEARPDIGARAAQDSRPVQPGYLTPRAARRGRPKNSASIRRTATTASQTPASSQRDLACRESWLAVLSLRTRRRPADKAMRSVNWRAVE
jgi:hypothetical protein